MARPKQSRLGPNVEVVTHRSDRHELAIYPSSVRLLRSLSTLDPIELGEGMQDSPPLAISLWLWLVGQIMGCISPGFWPWDEPSGRVSSWVFIVSNLSFPSFLTRGSGKKDSPQSFTMSDGKFCLIISSRICMSGGKLFHQFPLAVALISPWVRLALTWPLILSWPLALT